MFNAEQAHNQLLEKIASLERMLRVLVGDEDSESGKVVPRRDSERRRAALERRAHYNRLQELRQ